MKLFVAAALVAGLFSSAPTFADEAMAKAKNCMACHMVNKKLVGPGYKEVAGKYGGKKDMVAELTTRIIKGGTGVWGSIPMPPQTISEGDAKMIAQWIVDGAKQ